MVRAAGFEPAVTKLRSLLEDNNSLATRFPSDPLKKPFGASVNHALLLITCLVFSTYSISVLE